MKILSPLNDPKEALPLAESGAGEFYCGVLAEDWKKKYTNVGSINRREWSKSNLTSYDELREVVVKAHSKGARVFLTMNALYTAPQYDSLIHNLEQISKIDIDAVIVADLGLLLTLREMGWKTEVHVSTGGCTFNHLTARFYKDIGCSRVIIPRHNSVEEIVGLAKKIDFMEKECFIFNSGCKNIDGFCTYHHGVNEILYKGGWQIPKKLGLDFAFYKTLRNLPPEMAKGVTRSMGGCLKSDSICLLNFQVDVKQKGKEDKEKAKAAKKWIESTFCFYSGLDPCGACDLLDLHEAGIDSIKIVGRENPTHKKMKDVKFLKRIVDIIENESPSRDNFETICRKEYRKVYGNDCKDWCYYPSAKRSNLEGKKADAAA